MQDNTDLARLADLLYPHAIETVEALEAAFPPRELPEGARVTRFAPSPTGYLHLGGLFQVLIDERLAHQSGGVFYLRIEDTDRSREIEGGVGAILSGLASFGVTVDEGVTPDGEKGAYGPYRQSLRAGIYQSFAKKLVEEDKAYPCFCGEEKLSAMRAEQEKEKQNPGYYGKWACCRHLSPDEAAERVAAGEPFVLRLKADGSEGKTVTHADLSRGALTFPENDLDMVLIKSDGIPVYHFAHAVDDHLMKTTHVVRGEEWLATLPVHVQLFRYFGWTPPAYIHSATIMKHDDETGGKRKLSKRRDPEAAVSYFFGEGYPAAALIDYLMTLLNSNFEEWRAANPDAPYTAFPFTVEKLSSSGALFDFAKLSDVSKNTVSRMSADEVYALASDWAAEHDPVFHTLFTKHPDETKAMLSIGRGGDKPRKDIAVWNELKPFLSFFFDELFSPVYDFPQNLTREDILSVLRQYGALYDENDDQTVWFEKIKGLSAALGLAPDTKTFKKNPGVYRGHAGDVSMALRVAVTGRQNSPDLHSVMRILGKTRTLARLARAEEALLKL